jgi:hypothetical protein
MEVSTQLHAAVALPTGKETPRHDVSQMQSEHGGGGERNLWMETNSFKFS